MGGAANDAATWEIRRLDVETNEVTALTDNNVKDWSPVFTPDGGLLYLTEGDGHAAIARMDGDSSQILYDGAGYEWGISYSPSGDLITFSSDASGRDEIYLMAADGTNIRQVTELGGMGAEWLP
jgi:Tol biopolymer transport system component